MPRLRLRRPPQRRDAAIVVVGALLVGACTVQEAVNARVAEAIRAQLTRPETGLGPQEVEVSCPKKSSVKAGSVLDCKAKVAGEPVDVKAEYTSDDRYTLTPARAIINLEKVAQSLAGSGGIKSAKCGDKKVLVADPQTTFECTTTMADGSNGKVVERIDDVNGTLTRVTA